MCSRAKHIEIKDHFLRYHIRNDIVELQFVSIKCQLANLFRKPFTGVG